VEAEAKAQAEAERMFAAAIAAFSREKKAGDRRIWTVDGIAYPFRWCPQGTFSMGAPEDEDPELWDEEYEDDEHLHEVTLTKGFWMLETQVTQVMWESVMGTTVQQQRDKEDPGEELYGEGTEYPIYYVNWEESRTFCEKLSSKLGVQVSLPTEAQWEWCSDWYEEDYYAESPTSDPTGPNSGSYRVDRGGSWDYDAESCRSASRNCYEPGIRYYELGFRIVLAESDK